MEDQLEKLKYPIGRFDWSREVSAADLKDAIRQIAALPGKIRELVDGMQDMLDTPYRQDGWTVRQVVHHVADSHTNAYIRFKLALTEDSPTIKPYQQAEWAKLSDSKLDPAISFQLLDAIHARWVDIMENMTEEEWALGYIHPEHNAWQGLQKVTTMYAWHGEHHYTHILNLL